ncbi:MAG: hypothetical protein HOY78_37045 [Saccharothrix sp.]|nr:hypothetical protein [Saccharothrix sp.]
MGRRTGSAHLVGTRFLPLDEEDVRGWYFDSVLVAAHAPKVPPEVDLVTRAKCLSAFRHVNEEDLEQRYTLARRAVVALEALGFPVHLREGVDSAAGVEVAVDSGDYDTGGVYVSWNFGPELRLRMAEAVERGNFSDPVFEPAGVVAETMSATLRKLLVVAGFSVELAEDDLRPFALKIISGPAERVF